MEIRSRLVKRSLRRFARVDVAMTTLQKQRNEARLQAIVALDMAGIVVPTDADKPLHEMGVRITAVRPSDVVNVDQVELIKRFKKGITIEQLLNCVTGLDADKLDAVFGKGLVSTAPGEGAPTLRFSSDEDEAATAAATRLADRLGRPADQRLVDAVDAAKAVAKEEARAAKAAARRAA